MRNDLAHRSLRELKTHRKWHRKRRRIEVCRNALRSIDEVIKDRQAKYHEWVKVEFNRRLMASHTQQLAMQQAKQEGLI